MWTTLKASSVMTTARTPPTVDRSDAPLVVLPAIYIVSWASPGVANRLVNDRATHLRGFVDTEHRADVSRGDDVRHARDEQ